MKRFIVLLSSLFLLGGCASGNFGGDSAERVEHGKITKITVTRPDQSAPINLGTVIGGAAGGIIGHQFGGGSGKTALTIAGAVGGAVAGSEVQKATEKDRYEITVHLDSGGDMIVNQVGEGALRVGDRVRVQGSKIYRE